MTGPGGDVLHWRAATGADLGAIKRIADSIHAGMPEREEVFAEKLSLFDAACRVLTRKGDVVGYGIAHPWSLFEIPGLDDFLGELPALPDCLYIHDVAVLPAARGQGAVRQYVDDVAALALRKGIVFLALVSVYGTDVMWAHHGFRVAPGDRLGVKLDGYGATARYMVRRLD